MPRGVSNAKACHVSRAGDDRQTLVKGKGSGLPQRDGKRNDPYHDASKGRALFSSYFVVLLVFVCVEPSVLRHLSPAEGRLLLLQDQELHSQIITFFSHLF